MKSLDRVLSSEVARELVQKSGPGESTPVVGHRSPLAGLARRRLGFADVLGQSLSAVAPTGSAAVTPVFIVAAAGHGAVWSAMIAVVVTVVVASSINIFTRRMSAAGSLYTFTAKGLGPLAAFCAGSALLVGYGFITMFALSEAGNYVTVFISKMTAGSLDSSLLTAATIVVVGAGCTVVMARGVQLSTRVTLVIESFSIVVILGLIAALLYTVDGSGAWSNFSLEGVGAAQIATGTVIAITAVVGFESSAALGAETRHPFSAVPRAILWTALGSGLIFLLSVYSQSLGFADIDGDISTSAQPVNQLASSLGVSWIGTVLDVAVAASFIACALASATALVRVLLSMGREGVIPAVFGQTHPRFKTPTRAIGIAMPVLVTTAAVMVAVRPSVSATAGLFLAASAIGYVIAYVMVCLAAPMFLRRIGELTTGSVLVSYSAAAALISILILFGIDELSSSEPWGVTIALVTLVLALGWFGYAAMTRPQTVRRAGLYDETIAEDILVNPGAM